MKDVKNMNTEELQSYCIERKQNGASYQELALIFERNNTPSEVKKEIFNQLDKMDRLQKEKKKIAKGASKRQAGLRFLLLGIAVTMGGFFLFIASASQGYILWFNFFVWAFGGLMILRGVLHLFAGVTQNH